MSNLNDGENMSDIFKDIDEFNSNSSTETWNGTVRDFIKMAQDKPSLTQLSHARVLDMIESHGVTYEDSDVNKKNPTYNFFSGDMFGVDEGIHKVVSYLKAAASGSQVGRRILLMYGPTSSGKSQMATLIKSGLEDWTRTDAGALYGLVGTPMQESPLNAVPMGMRKKFREEYGINIDPLAKLSPLMQKILDEDYDGDWLALPVERVFISEAGRKGIGTFLPADSKSQDITELVGSVDFSKLGEYGVESDPRAYKFDGELNVANRGVMEMIEMLKVDQKFLYVLLAVCGEKTIKAPRMPITYIDEFILAHSNETEYRRFVGDSKLEALQDRVIVVKFPYNLQLDKEVKIYQKLVSEANFGDVHIAPLTLEVASMFAILSRLTVAPDQNLTLLKKLQLYNGDDVDGFTEADVVNIREDAEEKDEGMEGVSPRYVFNCISNVCAGNASKSVSPIDILREIKQNFASSAKHNKEDIERFDELLTTVVEEYTNLARNEVQKAFFLNFEGEIANLLNNYVDNIGAYLDGSNVLDEYGEANTPNEVLMRGIEEKVGVSDGSKSAFRGEIYRKVMKARAVDGAFDYTTHDRLHRALQEHLFSERADTIRLVTSTRSPDPEALEKLNSVIKTLVEKHGYNHDSANQLLRYVNSIMSK